MDTWPISDRLFQLLNQFLTLKFWWKHSKYNAMLCTEWYNDQTAWQVAMVRLWCMSRRFLGRQNMTQCHYTGVIMGAMASQITSLTIIYSTVYSSADHGKHQSSASLAFVQGIHRRPVNSQQKWPVTREMFPFDDVIMVRSCFLSWLEFHHSEPFTDLKNRQRCKKTPHTLQWHHKGVMTS